MNNNEVIKRVEKAKKNQDSLPKIETKKLFPWVMVDDKKMYFAKMSEFLGYIEDYPVCSCSSGFHCGSDLMKPSVIAAMKARAELGEF